MLNCTPCTFNNSSLKVLGVAGHMSAHCRAAFSVPFISSVHDVKLSHWFQMLECYIYNITKMAVICLSSYRRDWAVQLELQVEGASARRRQAQEVSRRQARNIVRRGFGLL